jgi:hypothetical protein
VTVPIQPPDPEHVRVVGASFRLAAMYAVVVIFMGVCAWELPRRPLQAITGLIGGAAALWLITYLRRRWYP